MQQQQRQQTLQLQMTQQLIRQQQQQQMQLIALQRQQQQMTPTFTPNSSSPSQGLFNSNPYASGYRPSAAEEELKPSVRRDEPDAERRARGVFILATEFEKAGERKDARDFCNKILSKYPETETAKEAQVMLTRLEKSGR
jgi:hypothetical protein